MKKAEFIELYQQIELMCGGSQEQATRMVGLLTNNLSALAGMQYDSLHHLKNGVNKYRTLFLFEYYAEHGSNVEGVWRSALASFHYWMREKTQEHTIYPLQESEIINWEPKEKGEVA